jgi:hypothetical protein
MTVVFSVVSRGVCVSKKTEETPKLTHADAAVILAKYSGFFDRYVVADAKLNECVVFLNKTGVYFGLLAVVNGTEFSEKDAAKALGQIDLVLTGKAKFSAGKVILPKEFASWQEFCRMNQVKYIAVYQTMCGLLREAYKQKSE